MWKKEVEVLGRLATLSQPSPQYASNEKSEVERERLFEEWTEEIRGVVGRCDGGGEAFSSKKTTKSSAKNTGKRGKGKKADEEREEDMDMGE